MSFNLEALGLHVTVTTSPSTDSSGLGTCSSYIGVGFGQFVYTFISLLAIVTILSKQVFFKPPQCSLQNLSEVLCSHQRLTSLMMLCKHANYMCTALVRMQLRNFRRAISEVCRTELLKILLMLYSTFTYTADHTNLKSACLKHALRKDMAHSSH